MVFPLREVPDVAAAANVSGPPIDGIHDCGIKANRKQYGAFVAAFTVKGRFNFLFHPVAQNGVGGKQEQQFVVDTDGTVNFGSELVSDFQVFRGEPATNTFGLKVGIQTFREVFIL